MANNTNLSWNGEGVSPFSARGLTQTLDLIGAASNIRRTINGDARNLSATQFRKYKSTISCSDQNPPALDDVWPGDVLVVDCCAELSYKTAGGAPARPVVAGSSYVEGDYTIYCPQLTLIVVSKDQSTDDYGHTTGWKLELEET